MLRKSGQGLAVLLVLSAVLWCAAACGGSEAATSTSAAVDSQSTTDTTVASSPATTAQATSTEETVEATETTAASATPTVELGNADNGRKIALNPGDRVRIDLKPRVIDMVKSVTWNYVPIVVQETNSGSEIVSDVVVTAWLELEATIVGPVTVRAEYEYPYGTVKTAWVVYLVVREPVPEED